MREIRDLLAAHPFFAGLAPEYLDLLVGCGRNVVFRAGGYIFRDGEAADRFYLLRAGRVALEVHAPGRAPLVIQTLHEEEVLGVSWLIPPYRWNFDARAMEDTRALALDAVCLRGKCDADPVLGYALMQRFVPELVRRLQATRLRLLDVYGELRDAPPA